MTILRFLWVVSLLCCASLGLCEDKELRGGWYVWDPYQYTSSSELGSLSLTGLDVQLTKEIATISRLHLNNTSYVKWKQHLDDLKNGTLDFACGATYTKERAEFAHYSIPYRFEENSLWGCPR